MVTDSTSTARLVLSDPAEQAGRILWLSGAQLVIGHSGSADLVIDDPFVSGRHALVTIDDRGRWRSGTSTRRAGRSLTGSG